MLTAVQDYSWRVPEAHSSSRLIGKRVVFVLAGAVVGGAERNALELAGHVIDVEGADVEILALDDRDGRARHLAAEAGISWTAVPVPWLGGQRDKALSLVRFGRELRRRRPDVVVASTNLPNVVAGLTWRLSGAKLCVWNQCDVLGTVRIGHSLFRRALSQTPLVVTTAFHARDWLVETFGVKRERVHVIYSKVELPEPREAPTAWRERLGIAPDDLAACMLGHLHVGKDHATLLRAWRLVVDRLAAEGRRAVLLLAGRPAGNEDAVKAIAFDLDLREHVRLLGDVDDVSGLLGAVDLAVFSSRSECLGRGATEPMFTGLPVVGTDVPGIREAVGEPGAPFLAAPGDAAGLADAILRLARDGELRARVGAASAGLIRSRQRAEVTTGAYAGLLANALAGGTAAVPNPQPYATPAP